MRSAASLLAPMFTPTTPGRPCRPREPRAHSLEPVAVEAEAVDDRFVPLQAEDARARVAGLRPRHDAAELHEAEAEREQRVGDLALLVEAGREPDRIGDAPPESRDREARVVARRRAAAA